jgi:hypothetical protein
MENYIRNQIVSHFEKHQIEINDEDILSIIDQTKSGVYAFQIIYVDNPLPGQKYININSPIWKFKLLKPLNRSNVEYNEEYDIWSYDGGKTFKYGNSETLIFDLRVIRELKLNQIL